MGASEARLFAREGAKVVFGDILDDEGKRAEAEIHEMGGDALYVHLDVTREADWLAAVELATDRYGKLDILVNNAGIGGGGRIEETTLDEWQRVMDVNSKGVFLGTKAAIPAMRAAGGGSIINISSQLGIVAVETSSAQYIASKGAVRLFTKATAVQYAGEGHQGQLGAPRSHRHAHDGGVPVQPGASGVHGLPDTPGALGRAGGGRLRGALPGLGRGVVRDGLGAGHRRGLDGPVAAPCLGAAAGREG